MVRLYFLLEFFVLNQVGLASYQVGSVPKESVDAAKSECGGSTSCFFEKQKTMASSMGQLYGEARNSLPAEAWAKAENACKSAKGITGYTCLSNALVDDTNKVNAAIGTIEDALESGGSVDKVSVNKGIDKAVQGQCQGKKEKELYECVLNALKAIRNRYFKARNKLGSVIASAKKGQAYSAACVVQKNPDVDCFKNPKHPQCQPSAHPDCTPPEAEMKLLSKPTLGYADGWGNIVNKVVTADTTSGGVPGGEEGGTGTEAPPPGAATGEEKIDGDPAGKHKQAQEGSEGGKKGGSALGDQTKKGWGFLDGWGDPLDKDKKSEKCPQQYTSVECSKLSAKSGTEGTTQLSADTAKILEKANETGKKVGLYSTQVALESLLLLKAQYESIRKRQLANKTGTLPEIKVDFRSICPVHPQWSPEIKSSHSEMMSFLDSRSKEISTAKVETGGLTSKLWSAQYKIEELEIEKEKLAKEKNEKCVGIVSSGGDVIARKKMCDDLDKNIKDKEEQIEKEKSENALLVASDPNGKKYLDEMNRLRGGKKGVVLDYSGFDQLDRHIASLIANTITTQSAFISKNCKDPEELSKEGQAMSKTPLGTEYMDHCQKEPCPDRRHEGLALCALWLKEASKEETQKRINTMKTVAALAAGVGLGIASGGIGAQFGVAAATVVATSGSVLIAGGQTVLDYRELKEDIRKRDSVFGLYLQGKVPFSEVHAAMEKVGDGDPNFKFWAEQIALNLVPTIAEVGAGAKLLMQLRKAKAAGNIKEMKNVIHEMEAAAKAGKAEAHPPGTKIASSESGELTAVKGEGASKASKDAKVVYDPPAKLPGEKPAPLPGEPGWTAPGPLGSKVIAGPDGKKVVISPSGAAVETVSTPVKKVSVQVPPSKTVPSDSRLEFIYNEVKQGKTVVLTEAEHRFIQTGGLAQKYPDTKGKAMSWQVVKSDADAMEAAMKAEKAALDAEKKAKEVAAKKAKEVPPRPVELPEPHRPAPPEAKFVDATPAGAKMSEERLAYLKKMQEEGYPIVITQEEHLQLAMIPPDKGGLKGYAHNPDRVKLVKSPSDVTGKQKKIVTDVLDEEEKYLAEQYMKRQQEIADWERTYNTPYPKPEVLAKYGITDPKTVSDRVLKKIKDVEDSIVLQMAQANPQQKLALQKRLDKFRSKVDNILKKPCKI